MSAVNELRFEYPVDRGIADVTVGEAFVLLCLFVGAWTIGNYVGSFIGERIKNAATGRDVSAG